MPKVSATALVMAVQAIEAEIRRLRALPDDKSVPGDAMLLDNYETIAEELEEVYGEAMKEYPSLPDYAQLVNRRD